MYILYNQNKVSWSLKLVFNDEGYLPFNFHNEKLQRLWNGTIKRLHFIYMKSVNVEILMTYWLAGVFVVITS
jgi:hypothetical protein